MKTLWGIFQLLVVTPFLAFVVFGITFLNTQTPVGFFAGIILGLLSAIGYWLLVAASGRKKIKRHIFSRIENADYFAILFDSAIAIDRANRKIFAGTIKHGSILAFEDITSIDREDTVVNGRRKHRIKISTNNFDAPYVVISSPTSSLAEQAFERLRIALDMTQGRSG
ncbi:hypothetical protein NPJ88_018660 [Halomonas elongata]|uniref:hypothetical protein n=1 Tax=Halomonas elongata TaxID=2746 RepID=UPI00255B2C5F|nr:hypothetical protein [Halomonas elongata]MDL4864359.1 hypothetical protein [Halomonas elongata]